MSKQLNELYSDWRAAYESAKNAAENGDEATVQRAMGALETAEKKWKTAEALDKAEASLTERKPTIPDLRNPIEAGDAPTVTTAQANGNPAGYIQLRPGVMVPYASKTTEGFIRNSPASVQLPSIMARYEPESDLWHEANWQRRAFDIYMRGGENSVKREAIKLGERDGGHLIRALNALQEDTASEGGYLVPTDQQIELIHDPGVPGGVTRPISRQITTSRDGGNFPVATTIAWASIAEEATPSDSDPVFSQVSFRIWKSGVNMTLSEELLADSAVNIPAYIGQVVDETSGRYEDQQAIEGDGTTEPAGLRTTGLGQGNVPDVTDLLTLTAPTLVEILNAYFELPAQFRGPGLYWHMTSSLMARISGISASGGQVWLLPDAGRPAFTILGAPVVMFDGTGWDNASTIAANEELGALGNYNWYWFIDRLGVVVRRDDSVGFRSDQVAFKARKRYDSTYAENTAFIILKAAAS